MLMFCSMLISNVAYADEPQTRDVKPPQTDTGGTGGGSSEDKEEDKESGDGLKAHDGKKGEGFICR